MANTVYQNFVLENKVADLLNTKLDTKSLMKIDTSLAETAGMIKKINTYSYTGAVEKVAKGAKNTAGAKGAVSFTTSQYEVEVAQHTFDYADEEFMQDNMIVEVGINGGTTLMVNDMNTKYFAELAKATLSQTYAKGSKISYDIVVDAIQKMNLEDESGLFLVIGTDLKADIRKDVDFKAKELGKIIADGAIGTISGVPVIVSKLVPAKSAYLATKDAVTCFTKKDATVEQDRNIETRTNTIVMGKVNIVALTDATKVVKISEAIA